MLLVPAWLIFGLVVRPHAHHLVPQASRFTAIDAWTDGVSGSLGSDDNNDLIEGGDSLTQLICNDTDTMRSNLRPEQISQVGNVDDVEILKGDLVGAKSSGRVMVVTQFAGSVASKGLLYHGIVAKFKGLAYPIHCVDRYTLRDISPYGSDGKWVADPYGLLRDKNVVVLTKAVKVRGANSGAR